MKIYISADIEGATGIVHGQQTGGQDPQYARGCEWMMGDVNAAIEGALEAGATEVVVKDSHASARNLNLTDLHPQARLISGWTVNMSMVDGLDESFEAVLLVGYHSRAGTSTGILSHTFSGVVEEAAVNGQVMGEPGLAAIQAGHYGVPVVFIAGDEAAVGELQALLGEVVGVVVKRGLGREVAELHHPEATAEMIRQGVAEALAQRSRYQPLRTDLPAELRLRLSTLGQAELVALVPGVKQVDARTIVYEAPDIPALWRLFRVAVGLAGSLR